MNRILALRALAVAAALASSAALAAPMCYTVYDRAGEIVYRDHVSPFEGALDPTSSGRETMRARGEHLVFFEADFCVPVSRVVGLGTASGRAPTTDEIVSTLPDIGGMPTRVTSGVAASMPPAAPAGAAPAARSASPPPTRATPTR
jgi:hypothetical protein